MGLLASVIHRHEEWIIVRQTCEDLSHSLFPRRPLSTGTAAETCRLEGKGAAWTAFSSGFQGLPLCMCFDQPALAYSGTAAPL